MARENARKVLQNSHATKEDICIAIYRLEVELQYIYQSINKNSAQETEADIRESLELIEQLLVRLAVFGGG